MKLEKEWRNKFEKLFETDDKDVFRISTSDFIGNTKVSFSSSNGSGSSGSGCAGGGFGGRGGGGR